MTADPLPPSIPPTNAPAPTPPRATRSPILAVSLSVLSGLGHVYLGQYDRAVIFALCFLGAITIKLPFVAFFIFFFAMIDAYRQAELINLGPDGDQPSTSLIAGGSYAFGLFLTVFGGVLLAHNVLEINLDWLRDWWPVILVVLGIWLIIGAFRERLARRQSDDPG